MKKVFLVLGLLLVSLSFMAACDDDDDKRISEKDLPEKVKTFINTHFETQTIRLAEEDKDSYDVYLDNGGELEFTLSGDWVKVDGKTQAIPQSILALLPEGILEYIAENYVNRKIYEVNKESFGYEIELDNRIELQFDSTGKFLRIDN